jgi:hypothetical protein
MALGLISATTALALMAAGGAWWQLIATGVQDALTKEFHLLERPPVTLEADPFCDLPWGRIPRLQWHLTEPQVQGVILPSIYVSLAGVQVTPQALMGLAPAQLCAPANVAVLVAADAHDLTRTVVSLVRSPVLQSVVLPPGPLRRTLGSPVSIEQPTIELAPGRIRLTADVVSQVGARKPVVLAFGLHSPDGRRLRLQKLEARINGKRVPGPLLNLLAPQLPALLDLRTSPWPGLNMHIAAVDVTAEGLTLQFVGQLAPASHPWLRPPGLPVLEDAPDGE